MDPGAMLSLFDTQVRAAGRGLPAGWLVDHDPPVVRARHRQHGIAMLTAPALDSSVAELNALIARTRTWFGPQGFEWKTYDHDNPVLRTLLREAGAEPGPAEALVLGEAAVLAGVPHLPPGLTLREVRTPPDFERIADLQSEVWQEDWSWLAADLAEQCGAPEPARVFVVEDGDLAVSAGWLTPVPATPVAGLWGGSTLAGYRGRGIYRALLAHRAQVALEAGRTLLQVDASQDSRPILTRLGMHVVGGTQPFEFSG